MKKEELGDSIREDEDLFFFTIWCLEMGIRKMLEDMDRGVNNRATQRFKKLDMIYGLSTSILK
jgi:hypothetical protein